MVIKYIILCKNKQTFCIMCSTCIYRNNMYNKLLWEII